MKSLEPIRFSSGIPGAEYDIVVGFGLGAAIVEEVKRRGERRVAIVSDDVVGKKLGADILSRLSRAGTAPEIFFFPHGEKSKNQRTVTMLQEKLLTRRYGRDTLIMALGGGIVGDIAGYLAATYLRGVPYIQIPTTLLAMVDSSIGGKVGVDTQYGKNTVGTIWQPSAVVADLDYLKSLPQQEIVSGLLEAVKIFFTSDGDALKIVDTLNLDEPLSSREAVHEIVARAAKLKVGVVARDEREENERRVLNFGHTVGHALEVLSGFTMPHGFAVGYGMLVEAKIAEDSGVLSAEDQSAVASFLSRFGVTPAGLADFAADDVLEAMKGDKKARSGDLYLVLLSSIGRVYTKGGFYAHKVQEDVIYRVFDEAKAGGGGLRKSGGFTKS